MKRFVFAALCVLLTTSVAFSVPVTIFQDTATFAKRSKDIIIATCDLPAPQNDYHDGLYPVDVTVLKVLKGDSRAEFMKIATIYPMELGRNYLLASMGGSVDGITFIAVPELSVVEIPAAFDMSVLEDKTLVEQLNLIFAARKAEVERQQRGLEREAVLLERALQKDPPDGRAGDVDIEAAPPPGAAVAPNHEAEAEPIDALIVLYEDPLRADGSGELTALRVADARRLGELEAFFSGYRDRPTSPRAGMWERGYDVYFNFRDGRSVCVSVSENKDAAFWSVGQGDFDTRGDFKRFVEDLRRTDDAPR